MPSLKQENENQIDNGYLYHEYFNNGSTPNYNDFESTLRNRRRNEMQVIRMDDFKGIRYNISNHSDDFEIYNVVTDPRESNNLAPNMAALQQTMHDKVLQVRKSDGSASRPYDNELIPSVDISGTTNGLEKKIFSGNVEWVPNFEYLNPIVSTTSSGIDLNTNGLDSEFGLYFNGFIEIPVDGVYTFYLNSASKCHIKLHDIHLLDNDFEFTTTEISETSNLKAGKHPIKIFYQQNENMTPFLNLQLEGPTISKGPIPNAIFFTNSTLSSRSEEFISDLKIYPQPVNNSLNIIFSSLKNDDASVSICSITGQKISNKTKNISIKNGLNTFNVDTRSLNSGMYFLRFQVGETLITKKFIKL